MTISEFAFLDASTFAGKGASLHDEIRSFQDWGEKMGSLPVSIWSTLFLFPLWGDSLVANESLPIECLLKDAVDRFSVSRYWFRASETTSNRRSDPDGALAVAEMLEMKPAIPDMTPAGGAA